MLVYLLRSHPKNNIKEIFFPKPIILSTHTNKVRCALTNTDEISTSCVGLTSKFPNNMHVEKRKQWKLATVMEFYAHDVPLRKRKVQPIIKAEGKLHEAVYNPGTVTSRHILENYK